MSMGVDTSTPLTKEEAAYLAERGRHQELQAAADRHGQDVNELLAAPDGDGTGPRTMPLNTDLRQIQEPSVLLARLREMGVNVEVKDTPVEPDVDDDNDVAPYEEWTVADLDTELKRRKLPTTGDKQAKVDRLYADDEKA
jgi:hypothetical protein